MRDHTHNDRAVKPTGKRYYAIIPTSPTCQYISLAQGYPNTNKGSPVCKYCSNVIYMIWFPATVQTEAGVYWQKSCSYLTTGTITFICFHLTTGKGASITDLTTRKVVFIDYAKGSPNQLFDHGKYTLHCLFLEQRYTSMKHNTYEFLITI